MFSRVISSVARVAATRVASTATPLARSLNFTSVRFASSNLKKYAPSAKAALEAEVCYSLL